jgi:hypothetical protein
VKLTKERRSAAVLGQNPVWESRLQQGSSFRWSHAHLVRGGGDVGERLSAWGDSGLYTAVEQEKKGELGPV